MESPTARVVAGDPAGRDIRTVFRGVASDCTFPLASLLPPRGVIARSPRQLGSRSPRWLGSRSPRQLGSRSPRWLGSRSPRWLGSRSPRWLGARSLRWLGSWSPAAGNTYPRPQSDDAAFSPPPSGARAAGLCRCMGGRVSRSPRHQRVLERSRISSIQELEKPMKQLSGGGISVSLKGRASSPYKRSRIFS